MTHVMYSTWKITFILVSLTSLIVFTPLVAIVLKKKHKEGWLYQQK